MCCKSEWAMDSTGYTVLILLQGQHQSLPLREMQAGVLSVWQLVGSKGGGGFRGWTLSGSITDRTERPRVCVVLSVWCVQAGSRQG
jgi:hypothetical protein